MTLLRVLQGAGRRLKWAGCSWVEEDGAGWSWVHGLVIPIKKIEDELIHKVNDGNYANVK